MRISTTQTVTVAPSRITTAQPTLRLRGQVRGPEERTENARGIRWAEDVVDNEGLGRKSSKGELVPVVVQIVRYENIILKFRAWRRIHGYFRMRETFKDPFG